MTYDIQSGVSLDPGHEMAVDAELRKLDSGLKDVRYQARGRRVTSINGFSNTTNDTAIVASRDFMAAAERVELPTFYRMAEGWEYLVWLLEDPNSDEDAIQAELQRLVPDIRQKAHALAVVVQGIRALAARQKFEADQHKAETERLADKAKATNARGDRLEAYGLKCMDMIGERRIETGVFTLAKRLNNPKVEVKDESAIPADYWRQPLPPLEIDKAKILEHWKATGGKSTPDGVIEGESVPGTAVVRTARLEIR